MTATRAILLNTSVFFADNNIRRNISTYATNYVTSAGNANVQYLTVAAGTTYTYTPPTLPASFFLLNTSGPLFATVSVATESLGTVTRSSSSLQMAVNAMYVTDDEVTQVIIQNPQTYDIQVSIIQG